MIHYHEMEQGSPEWREARKGMLSASNATPIGANAAGLKTYCKEIAQALIGVDAANYINAVMQRGTNLEPIARMAYELEFGVTIREVGGVTNDIYKNVWISPDGLIDDDDGGCEIKARNDAKHFALITGDFKEVPFNQIQMTLLVSGRKYWDFVSFNPNFSKPLFVKRIYPDLVYHEKLKIGFAHGNKLIKQYVEEYNNYIPKR